MRKSRRHMTAVMTAVLSICALLCICLTVSIQSQAVSTRQTKGSTGFQRNPGSGSAAQQENSPGVKENQKKPADEQKQAGSGQTSTGNEESTGSGQTSAGTEESAGSNTGSASVQQVAVCGEIGFSSVKASSVLPASTQSSYVAANAADYDRTTAWVENAAGTGEGEYLEFACPEGTIITAVQIMTGYHKNEDVFYKNAAPSAIIVSSGGSSQTLDLSLAAENFKYKMVLYPLEKPVVSDGAVRFTISKARKGSLWEDTCITEVHCLGIPAGDSAMWDADKLVSINLNAFYLLGDEAYRLAYLFGKEVGGIGSTVYQLSGLSDEDKAFLLYWYTYMASDPRILDYNDEVVNEVSRDDLLDILEELTGEADEGVLAECIYRYAERAERGVVRFYSAGDFGETDGMWFDQDHEATLENGKLKITGHVRYWDDSNAEYIDRGTFEAYYTEGGPVGAGGYRLEKVDVKLN